MLEVTGLYLHHITACPEFCFCGRKWEDNIKVYVNGTISEGVDWINLTRARNKRQSVVKTAMKLQVP